MDIRTERFGLDPQGRPADLITITNRAGASVSLTDFGAHLVSVKVPDREGRLREVCLGFDSPEPYARTGNGYLGATVGRYANRIGGASFPLNGRIYLLSANDGPNTLHGGREGFDKRRWEYQTRKDPASGTVVMNLLSADGEEGFPGELRVGVSFSFGDDNRLVILYSAETDADTVINLTNHAYFNLAGEGDILGHLIRIDAARVISVDSSLIPTGEMTPVDGTLYDLRSFTRIGDRIARADEHPMLQAAKGFDVGYVLSGQGLRLCAELRDPASGRSMELHTDQPGVQFYSGQGLKGSGHGGMEHRAYSGLAMETQHHPDSVHHPAFGSTVLRPGELYRTTTAYAFGIFP